MDEYSPVRLPPAFVSPGGWVMAAHTHTLTPQEALQDQQNTELFFKENRANT